MTDDTPKTSRTITLLNESVVLDSEKLKFNEATLSKFQENVGLYYDFFGQKLAVAEYLRDRYETEYEILYAKKYVDFKVNQNLTDKAAECSAKSHPDVAAAKLSFLAFKQKAKDIQQHLRAWDKAHESAQNRGHTLRKEMDKLSTSVFSETDDIEKIIGGGN